MRKLIYLPCKTFLRKLIYLLNLKRPVEERLHKEGMEMKLYREKVFFLKKYIVLILNKVEKGSL